MPTPAKTLMFTRGLPVHVWDRDPKIEFSTRRGAASLSVARSVAPGKHWFRSEDLHVPMALRRKGIATRLYESAAKKACSEGRRLVSDSQRSSFAEAFWRKQARKGRARCFITNPRGERGRNYFDQITDVEYEIAHEQGGEPDYERAQRVLQSMRLPRPRRSSHDGELYWPCFRWGLKRKLCKERSISLEGLGSTVSSVLGHPLYPAMLGAGLALTAAKLAR